MTRWLKASLPASSLNWFIKFNGRPAPPSLNISNYSITAGGAIRRSAIAAPLNLNDVPISGSQLNPGFHQLGRRRAFAHRQEHWTPDARANECELLLCESEQVSGDRSRWRRMGAIVTSIMIRLKSTRRNRIVPDALRSVGFSYRRRTLHRTHVRQTNIHARMPLAARP